jgi:hypothetical protein
MTYDRFGYTVESTKDDSYRYGFSEADAEELRVWSGALPAIINAPARPWNGRELTVEEKLKARWIYSISGAQAAYEWLSENAK